MKNDNPTQPLMLTIQLTDEQRRQLLEETGQVFGSLPVRTGAASVRVQFAGMTLRIPRGVFVPTPSAEQLLRVAIAAAPKMAPAQIIEVGTGCGALALALARARPNVRIHAADLSDLAVHSARANRSHIGVRNVRFYRGSLLDPIPARLHRQVAVIIANLPYVPARYSDVMKDFFPEGTAIGVGEDGLDLVRTLARTARHFLTPGGSLVLQLAGFQWPGFTGELCDFGYDKPEFLGDFGENTPQPARIRFRASR